MFIHEYQAKLILKQYGIKVPTGYLIEHIDQIEQKARKIQTDSAVIKAQIHAGGRGKAGGVKIVDSISEAINVGKNMLGKELRTNQTGQKGKVVRKLYIEEACEALREFYLSCIVDYATGQTKLICSKVGGVDVEELSRVSPESITMIYIDPIMGLKGHQVQFICKFLNLSYSHLYELEKLLKGMVQMLEDRDLLMLELNPVALSSEGELVALDAKVVVDANALYRQIGLEMMRDFGEEEPREVQAAAYGMSYVALEGDVACLVNGAGLAMATVDAITRAGGKSANFLDVGGGASGEMIEKALEIIQSDKQAKVIFINIFGGILSCDLLAKSLINAIKDESFILPVVLRLEGHQSELAKFLIESSGLNMHLVNHLEEGAKLASSIAKWGDKSYEHLA